MKYFLFRMKRFCGFVTGFIFFISGILKLMDPVGAGLVMKEYFKFLHLGFLNFVSPAFGLAFAFAEVLIGAGLITGVWRKTVAVIAIALQSMFTLLTLILVIFKPEMDCEKKSITKASLSFNTAQCPQSPNFSKSKKWAREEKASATV